LLLALALNDSCSAPWWRHATASPEYVAPWWAVFLETAPAACALTAHEHSAADLSQPSLNRRGRPHLPVQALAPASSHGRALCALSRDQGSDLACLMIYWTTPETSLQLTDSSGPPCQCLSSAHAGLLLQKLVTGRAWSGGLAVIICLLVSIMDQPALPAA
jgi:hypothetical protein